MIPAAILERLRERGVRHCVIGASALAAHQFVRASMDVDLLTDDESVLRPAFWTGVDPAPECRRGDPTDPVEGVVRWSEPVAVDLVLSRNFAARYALDSATPFSGWPAPIPSPLAIVLLKLEAGGPRDRTDIVSLIETRRQLDGAPWLADLPRFVPKLTRHARETWTKLEPSLSEWLPSST